MRVHKSLIISNDTYDIYDWKVNYNNENKYTFSKTILKAGKSTRGHSHANQDELYHFTVVPKGDVRMIIGEETFPVKIDDMFYVPEGKFHRVVNNTGYYCEFDAIFIGVPQRPKI